MPYTVNRPGGMDDFEFRRYAHQLEEHGIDLSNMPRVMDPKSKRRWLHVWDDQPAAERFVERLRAFYEDPAWAVYPVEGELPPPGPIGPIIILSSWQGNGCGYALEDLSERLIHRRFPGAKLVPRLFIEEEARADNQPDIEMVQERLWDQVAQLLTGLTWEQIDELGGYRLYNRKADRVLRDVQTVSAAATG
jgi:hypothetical protein